jgi:hypothetical protein
MSQPSDQSESKTFEIKLGFPLARFHKKQKRLSKESDSVHYSAAYLL